MIAGSILFFNACQKESPNGIRISEITSQSTISSSVLNENKLKRDTTYLNFLKSEVNVFNLKLNITEVKRLMKIENKSTTDI